jgi:hypothetical protein
VAGEVVLVSKKTKGKAELLALASDLKIPVAHALGLCVIFWDWAEDQTTDGLVRGVTSEAIDTYIGMPGFSDALRKVGWLQARSGSLVIPGFDRHMGQLAKARAFSASRMALKRARDCYADVTQEAQQEEEGGKGGEEWNLSSSSPKGKKSRARDLSCPEGFVEFWVAWPKKVRKEEAIRAWRKLKPAPELRAKILAAIVDQQAWDSRFREWQYIPHPATWLNGREWENEKTPAGGAKETTIERNFRIVREREEARKVAKNG